MKKITMYGLVALLAGCSQSHLVLDNPNQVQAWMAQVQLQTAQQVNAEPRDLSLFSAQLPLQMKHVFASVAPSVPKTNPVLPLPLIKKFETTDSMLILPAAPMVVQKTINISQAAASELKYAGLLTRDGQTMGMVKVAERLYPVRVGDVIGQGKWPVLDVNAQTMQIKIAQKAVVYEKN